MNAPNPENFKPDNPKMMRALRERAECTQIEWAQKVGCSDIKVRRIELGLSSYDYATQYLWERTAARTR